MAGITVYGADWCPKTAETLKHLDKLGIRYEYIDIEENRPAARWVKEQNDGKEKKPTVDVEGRVLSEPSNAELDAALRAAGLAA